MSTVRNDFVPSDRESPEKRGSFGVGEEGRRLLNLTVRSKPGDNDPARVTLTQDALSSARSLLPRAQAQLLGAS